MSRLSDLTRGWAFGLVALLAFAGLYFASPDQMPVAMWKLGLVTLGGFVGYWLDRHLFPYARPHNALDFWIQSARGEPAEWQSAGIYVGSMIRRAIIVAATVIGFALAI